VGAESFGLVWAVDVTLTYPGEFVTAGASKVHLDAWLRRLGRRVGKWAGIWRIEPQQRGAPHYHGVFFVSPDGLGDKGAWLDELRRWVSQSWYEVVGSGDERHLRAGTRVALVQSYRHFLAYVSKYHAKVLPEDAKLEGGWERPGRWWGLRGRAFFKSLVTGQLWTVSRAVALRIRRILRRRAPAAVRRGVVKRERRGISTFWTWGGGDEGAGFLTRLVLWAVGECGGDAAQAEVCGGF